MPPAPSPCQQWAHPEEVLCSWPITVSFTQCHSHTGDKAKSPDLGMTTVRQAHLLPPHLGTNLPNKKGTRPSLLPVFYC